MPGFAALPMNIQGVVRVCRRLFPESQFFGWYADVVLCSVSLFFSVVRVCGTLFPQFFLGPVFLGGTRETFSTRSLS